MERVTPRSLEVILKKFENSIWRHILISPGCHSYNCIDIRRLISILDMCHLSLCSNYSQTFERKIVEETQKTQIETQITQKKLREKQQEKNFNLKT